MHSHCEKNRAGEDSHRSLRQGRTACSQESATAYGR
jgi:hypothetical protein